MGETKTYRTLNEFYPYYLSEHANRTSLRLHFVGTTTALALLITTFVTQMWWLVARYTDVVASRGGLCAGLRIRLGRTFLL